MCCCAFQAAVLSAQAASSPQAPADFFVLVQQWGESQCDQKGKSCAQPPSADHFTIHGLWANYNDGRCVQGEGGARRVAVVAAPHLIC